MKKTLPIPSPSVPAEKPAPRTLSAADPHAMAALIELAQTHQHRALADLVLQQINATGGLSQVEVSA